MEVTISGTLDEAALRRAVRVQTQGLRLLGIALLAMAAFNLVVSFTASETRDTTPQLTRVVVLGVLGGLFSLVPALSARRLVKTSKLLRSPTVGSASERGLKLTMEHGSLDLPWDRFHQAKVLQGAVVLYEPGLAFYVLPREFFKSDAEWDAFLGWVRSQVKRPHRATTVSISLIRVIIVVLITLVLALLVSRLA